jgi:trypsin-like peptidase
MRTPIRISLPILITAFFLPMSGQTPATQPQQPPSSPAPAPSAALSTQVKKTVVYLQADCLHDFSAEASSLGKEQLAHMPLPQETSIVQRLVKVTSKMQAVKASMSKLSTEETAYLMHPNPLTSDPEQLATEGAWRVSILLKMTALTESDVQAMTPDELDGLSLSADQSLGTGFLVVVPNDPAKVIANPNSEITGFTYLVTNRHVVQPGIDIGQPCKVPLRTFLMANHKPDSTHPSIFAETIRVDQGIKWSYSTDDSVDLAVAPIGIAPDQYDYLRIPTTQFLTRDEMEKRVAVEGDPVFFSGLFVQFFDQEVQPLDPIVRSGTLAMVPEGLLPTTMQKRPGHVLLTDAHVFGGNSGSPVFVDTARFAGVIGSSFRFLGVVSGEVFEKTDLTFTVTTSISGSVGANSDVSMVVPAWQVLDILAQPDLKKTRDDYLAAHPPPAISDSGTPKP